MDRQNTPATLLVACFPHGCGVGPTHHARSCLKPGVFRTGVGLVCSRHKLMNVTNRGRSLPGWSHSLRCVTGGLLCYVGLYQAGSKVVRFPLRQTLRRAVLEPPPEPPREGAFEGASTLSSFGAGFLLETCYDGGLTTKTGWEVLKPPHSPESDHWGGQRSDLAPF